MTGIYYGDLFIINGCGCLVMGYGKSKTCRHFTGENTIEVFTDLIKLDIQNNELIGYASIDNSCNTKIRYLVRMLNKEETQKLNCTDIVKINKDQYATMCDINIIYGLNSEQEQANRREEFRCLIKNVDLICILVPWCTSMENKGNLIGNYIKK